MVGDPSVMEQGNNRLDWPIGVLWRAWDQLFRERRMSILGRNSLEGNRALHITGAIREDFLLHDRRMLP